MLSAGFPQEEYYYRAAYMVPRAGDRNLGPGTLMVLGGTPSRQIQRCNLKALQSEPVTVKFP